MLLLGYSGANNTGAEALLLADIEDVRAVLGPDAVITIPTINPANLKRYVKETPNLRISFLPTIFFAELRRLVRGQRPDHAGRRQHVYGHLDLCHAVGIPVDDALRGCHGKAVRGIRC